MQRLLSRLGGWFRAPAPPPLPPCDAQVLLRLIVLPYGEIGGRRVLNYQWLSQSNDAGLRRFLDRVLPRLDEALAAIVIDLGGAHVGRDDVLRGGPP